MTAQAYEMARHALTLHADSRCAALTAITVEVARPTARALTLRYTARGAIGDLRLPPPAASTRTDELWRSTCFEAFIRPNAGEAYYEFNFAPSTQWAAYAFTGYRAGMAGAAAIAAPRLAMRATGALLELDAALDLSALAGDGVWRLAISAVIEETSGDKSYWALAHAPGQPDFHHADGFVCDIATGMT